MLKRKHVKAFLACLDEERYYDAHEVLEAVWFPVRADKSPEVLLIKGLINASVSFELLKRGRPHKAAGPWNVYMKYREYLQQVGTEKPQYFTLDEAVHRVQKVLNG